MKRSNYVNSHISLTQGVNTTPFCAGTQVLAPEHQVWAAHYFLEYAPKHREGALIERRTLNGLIEGTLTIPPIRLVIKCSIGGSLFDILV